MKQEERFITVKEERARDAVLLLWFAVGWLILCTIASLSQDGNLLEDEENLICLIVFGVGGALLLLLFGGIMWLSGMRAKKERETIMRNGQKITAVVSEVQSEMVRAGRWHKTQRHRVVVQYSSKNGEAKSWTSPQYSLEPYDYVGLQKECTLYLWGNKGCLEDVLPRKKNRWKSNSGNMHFSSKRE